MRYVRLLILIYRHSRISMSKCCVKLCYTESILVPTLPLSYLCNTLNKLQYIFWGVVSVIANEKLLEIQTTFYRVFTWCRNSSVEWYRAYLLVIVLEKKIV